MKILLLSKNRIVPKMIEDWSEKEYTLWMECPNSIAKSLLSIKIEL